MKIYLDGCDGTGKTSVAEKLANKYGCNIIHLTNKGSRSFRSYLEMFRCDNMVHDRTFLSEVIYPKYFGRPTELCTYNISSLYEMLNEVHLFILTASPETILKRVRERGDDFIDDYEKLIDINKDYLKLAEKHGYTVIDTTNKSIDDVVEEIGGYLKDARW